MTTPSSDTTTGVRDWYASDGALLGSVVPHPRISGAWLAMLCPALTTRDKPSGWYRYKTWKGACALVEKKIASASKIPVDVSA